MIPPEVVAVAARRGHHFSKTPQLFITLISGEGVEGDAHRGATVKHRSRVAVDPSQPNLRQVHLIQSELFDELRGKGFDIAPAQMGENITTRGVDLLALPRGTELAIGATRIEITGLRNPCSQIDTFRAGLLKAVIDRDADGGIVRKAGVMGIVREGGDIRPGDTITVVLPAPPHVRLERV